MIKKFVSLIFVFVLIASVVLAKTGNNTSSVKIAEYKPSAVEVVQKHAQDTISQHIALMNNLKTCTKSSAYGLAGYEYVLGLQNGKCYYKTSAAANSYVLCAFPMPVAKQYAIESINVFKTGNESSYNSYINSVSNKYCKIIQGN